jgi:CMP-N-acetylneuraminic acid synthetase
MNKHYALIPAKAESSRCVNKNWRPFSDHMNLVDHLLSLIPDNLFDSIIISTDKADVQITGKATIHYRDKSLATEKSAVNDLIPVIIDTYGFDDDGYIWLLNPTSPFRKKEDFIKIRAILLDKGCKSLISISKIHPFLWKDNVPLFDTGYPRQNTQDIAAEYGFENGQFIVFRVDAFKKTKTWYNGDVYLFKQSSLDSFIDIDTESDFIVSQKWADSMIIRETMKNETLMLDYIIKEPLQAHLRLLSNHFLRYGTAARMLNVTSDDLVLDSSCGLGYGSYILSFKAKKVVGLDINHEYICRAKELFSSPNTEFYIYNEYESLLKAGVYPQADKIVCIETLEHLPKAQMHEFLSRLFVLLKKGGDMFLTVPLGENMPNDYNEFHLNEPSIDTLYGLFINSFDRITFEVETLVNSFGQEMKYCLVQLSSFKGGGKCYTGVR